MRVVRCVALMACCLALVGCSLFGKKAPPKPSSDVSLPRGDAPAGPTAPSGPEPAGSIGGIIAGQVVDSYSRRPPVTYIQVSLPPGEQAGAPIDVAADGQGYFTIQGLLPGRHYQLIARSQDGERKLAGTVWATPPNPRVYIRMSEDFNNSRIPAVPGPPTYPGKAGPPAVAAPPAPAWPTEGAAPSTTDEGKRPAGLGAPVNIEDPAEAPKTPPAARLDRVAEGPYGRNTREAPPAAIRGPAIIPPPLQPIVPPAPPAPAAPGQPGAAVPVSPARVPSCVLTGQQLVNFALNDVNGQPWEFRDHRARLTLVDFWGTWCTHCLHAIPHLKILQDKYSGYGLQVVGIAYEEGPTAEQIQKVNRVRQRHNIPYTVLLGGGDTGACPVRAQFDVRVFPTLILIDETGRIIWRAQGLDKQQLAELETLIRQRLGVR